MGIKVVDYGLVKGNSNIEAIDRIIKVVNELVEIAKEKNISEVIIEDIQLQYKYGGKGRGRIPVNVDTFKKLANLQGLLYGKLTEAGFRVHILPSSTWKSVLEIKGKARAEQKRNAQVYIKATYKLQIKQDICDSICIGTAWLKQNNYFGTIMAIDQATLDSGYSILEQFEDIIEEKGLLYEIY